MATRSDRHSVQHSHRAPINDELDSLMTVLTSGSLAKLVPVRFNGEQRYAIGVPRPDGRMDVLAICPTPVDQVVSLLQR